MVTRRNKQHADFNGSQLANMEKVGSLHVPAINFIGWNQLVENVPIMPKTLDRAITQVINYH